MGRLRNQNGRASVSTGSIVIGASQPGKLERKAFLSQLIDAIYFGDHRIYH